MNMVLGLYSSSEQTYCHSDCPLRVVPLRMERDVTPYGVVDRQA